ncbi:hypothetical protein ACFQMA_22605 [Halosimplex aquaticum]|uniref:Uncharacterized protein n=1 Tax=Halosimplex aquaticum TaxID=3026162 RepID=A0ABD5Y8G2_9EURY|nr:hypothetical protein [Halosimplex aquaticum]
MARQALFGILLCLVVAGCIGGPGPSTPASGTETPAGGVTPTAETGDGAGSGVDTPTPTPGSETSHRSTPAESTTSDGRSGTPTAAGNVSVEYLVRVDSLPDHVANVTIEFGSAYFSEVPDDLRSCSGVEPLMDNRYDPTPTPLPTPAASCWEADAPSVTLAPGDGTRSLGRFTASERYSGGHMLVVRDVVVTLENGTAATQIYDTDFRAVYRTEPAAGRHGVGFTVDYDPTPGERRDYVIDVDWFEPTD